MFEIEKKKIPPPPPPQKKIPPKKGVVGPRPNAEQVAGPRPYAEQVAENNGHCFGSHQKRAWTRVKIAENRDFRTKSADRTPTDNLSKNDHTQMDDADWLISVTGCLPCNPIGLEASLGTLHIIILQEFISSTEKIRTFLCHFLVTTKYRFIVFISLGVPLTSHRHSKYTSPHYQLTFVLSCITQSSSAHNPY